MISRAIFLNQSTEDPLRGKTFQKLLLATLLIFFSIANVACGGKLEGTYSNLGGNVMLELRSGGNADLTLSGETQHCGSKADNKKGTVTGGRDALGFRIPAECSMEEPCSVRGFG